ncbi:hypothetical protein QYM36_016137 [Artemia franciscana]|uniref:F-box/LRR-repeat protein 15-like leucin rich repeat domain-containing protein n=1 Tax=Artemia franciscana TaxID=6661 RepID=A0AA88HBL0_ARTSF|nr:hypothetical protein QYM36_016137 [Artemia franciscana]
MVLLMTLKQLCVESISPQLCQDVLNQLKKKKKLKKHHYDVLIASSTEGLDLSMVQNDVGHPLTLAALRSSDSLKCLDLAFCLKIPKKILKEVLSCLKNLEVLKLTGTNCSDEILSVVGAYGSKLKDLNVASCKDVSDSGISAICYTMNDLGDESKPICSNLQRLNVGHTRVTDTGIRVALLNLHNLRIFECGNSVGVIANIHRKDWENGKETTKYKLIDLYMESGTDFVEYDFHIAASLCPNVIRLKIACGSEVFDKDLLAFMELKDLRELHIGGETDTNVSFYGGIMPLLQIRGRNLDRLTLAELSGINIDVVGELCSNLKHLNIFLNDSYSGFRPPSLPKPSDCVGLRVLETLRIVCQTSMRLNSDIPSLHLVELLTAPTLRYIYIKDCQSLSDDLLMQVLNLNQFEFLEHFEIEQCHNITGDAIETILSLKKPPKQLKMWSCRNIIRRSFENIKSVVKQKGIKMNVEWM